jgi:filamentous hemagglutinin family protein
MLKQSFHVFRFLATSYLLFAVGIAGANPQGMTVVSGSAHSRQQGNVLQITTSQNTVLQWNSFNIAAGQTTIFDEPSATSIVFNNIRNANPSAIFGSLQANGIVVLENANGFYFGPNAFVKAGGLVVTTAAIDPWSSAAGAGWSFDGPPAASPIVNYGHLQTASGGSLFLIAKQIDNRGSIEAPGGTAALLAGQEVLLSERPDGLSLSAPVRMPAGSVDNQGRIVADAGTVLLQAQTVNNSGAIQANSVRQQNGVIELYASQDLQLTASSVLQADGGGDGINQAGNIVLKSGGAFSDSAGSQISATGGADGGNGGNVEVSAPNILSLNSMIDASAQAGWNEGLFSLDPENIVLGTFSSGSTSAGASGVINARGGSGTVDVDVGSAFQDINASILLQATGDITLNPGTTWNLSASTGRTTGQLTLEAHGDINIGAQGQNAAITDANDWSVTMEAGYNFRSGQGVIPGLGNVTLYNSPNASSEIQTAAGNINILAGDNVTIQGTGGIVTGIANGAVMTGTGGNIRVQAVAGSVNCGSSTAGYDFEPTGTGYVVDPNLGGISTAGGGNVNIQAGGNISAFLPDSSQDVSDSGSGAFGASPGNVTLTAGGNVIGHYVVANGTGAITAANAGTSSSQSLALSLINGGWVVNASDDIFLQEVRNPNGMFNGSQLNSVYAPTAFLYNYSPLASVSLNAGNGVTITGADLPRVSGADEALIFPPILNINAGPGGITLDKSVNLFPSPEGTLDLTTSGGGNLGAGGGAGSDTLCISDSQSASWTNPKSFTSLDSDANELLHLDDPNPVLINISGSVSDLTLVSPKPVEMYVTGNIIDSIASIENLRPTDATVISAGGQIFDHSSFVILPLPAGETPDFAALASVEDPYLNAITLAPTLSSYGIPTIPNPNYNSIFYGITFTYDAATRNVLYSGIMSSALEAALLQMTTPFLDANSITQIYNQSQQEATRLLGSYQVAGPGTFQLDAASIDLGNGGGLVSAGIAGYAPLAPYTATGANIDISVSGNISMLSSTIESEYGGAININCGGTIDIGSALVPSFSNQRPLGIVSLWGGNINVIANGNINVDGSRIAAYDGGNIFVESLDGDVNAGSGGSGSVLVTKPYLNQNGQLEELNDVIPGSGILATSYPQLVSGQTSGQIGNITVETPLGNIVANQGGISQLALGPVAHNDATINLNAGSRNSDGTVAFVGDVDAAGSGVIGGQVNITATGNINGLVVASVGANVNALQNVSATVLSQGAASVSAGGTVSGTVVGVGTVSVSGAVDVAAAFGGSGVSTSGAVSGAAVAAAPTASNSGAAAATTQQVTQSTQSNSDLAANDNAEDNDKKKKKKQLMEYVGRVTVLLPEK